MMRECCGIARHGRIDGNGHPGKLQKRGSGGPWDRAITASRCIAAG